AGAVGVAVVPRLALLPSDFRLDAALYLLDFPGELANLVLVLGIMGGVFAAGWWRFAPERNEPAMRKPMRMLGLVLTVVGLAHIASFFFVVTTGLVSLAPAYGLRWLLFAGILFYGVLAFEVLEFERASERLVPVVGAVLASLGAALGTLAWSAGLPASASGPIALGVAAGVALPAGFATRVVVRARQAGEAPGASMDRRLALYQASLEAVWARGPPSSEAREILEQDRRSFGVSFDEARVLEHVVAQKLAERAPRFRPGDEPATGLVLDQVLGEGAHGRVFAARWYPEGTRVVVKEYSSRTLDREEERRRMFAELRVLRGLAHPNIVRVLDARVSDGRPLLVMERVDGAPLSVVLGRGPLPEAKVRDLAADLLDALETAHGQGFVHRDIKPSNILAGRDGRYRLTDFGIAALAGEQQPVQATVSNLDALGALAGTLMYMAPEQVGGAAASPASDLYAVGLVLYEALTGQPAVDVRDTAVVDAIARVGKPAIDWDAAPGPWQGFLRKALDADPRHRYGSASAMRKVIPKAQRAGR
ncbi:MAG TPA: serine/threonine-protein kinase, partial [Candidatus Thermoplasmatota archaeon]|nr:serine/threonine-protein kinase [Candidatus Thermoplasmatota archaeon]